MSAGASPLIHILKCWRAIFTNPTSAMKKTPGSGKARKGHASLNNYTQVGPHSIAYAAIMVSTVYLALNRAMICLVQAYHALSNAEDWRIQPYGVDKDKLYDYIVSLFDKPKKRWPHNTLKWWSAYVYRCSAYECR